MPSTLFASSWAKFNWAQQHLKALDKALVGVYQSNERTLTLKVDLQVAGDTAVVLVSPSTIPAIHARCGLLIGDTLHSFRGALDHLVWDLVRIGGDPRPKKPRFVQFPMSTSRAAWNEWVERRLPGIPEEQRAIILSCQPYRRGERARNIRRLRDFSDHDKHRVLMPVYFTMSSLNFSVQTNWLVTEWEYLIKRPTRIDRRTKFLRVELTRGPNPGDCQVRVDGETTAYPTLSRGIQLTALNSIRDTVFNILMEFENLL